MKNYWITRQSSSEITVTVTENSKPLYQLTPEASLKARSHSPAGFNFGYGGSGPAQLALAILMDFTGEKPDEWSAPWPYQAFKFKFLAMMNGAGGTITGEEITAFLRDNPKLPA